jgi:hypothetical protein
MTRHSAPPLATVARHARVAWRERRATVRPNSLPWRVMQVAAATHRATDLQSSTFRGREPGRADSFTLNRAPLGKAEPERVECRAVQAESARVRRRGRPALVDDFRLRVNGTVARVRNAPSPAATSSPAIAEELLRGLTAPQTRTDSQTRSSPYFFLRTTANGFGRVRR